MKDLAINETKTAKAAGVLYVAASYVLWGFLPLYWKLLNKVPSDVILAYRVLWSFVFVGILVLATGSFKSFLAVLKDQKSMISLLLCSVLISVNWGLYIWAVNSGHMIEASLGYYINPLMVVTLSILILHERLTRLQYGALTCAAIGVLYLAVSFGKVPWVSLLLAGSFALYGLLKKTLKVSATVGMALETSLLAPIALGYILLTSPQQSAMAYSSMTWILLVLSGVATATPLLWFAKGTQRIEFSTVGFLQYIAPTISLMLGVFVFKEHFSAIHAVSFGFIWAACVLYTLSKTVFIKK